MLEIQLEIVINNMENDKKSIHQGKNVKRLREAKGVKQEVIAMELDITQQAVSQLEKRQELDDVTIAAYAKALEINEDFIRNMTDNSLPENSNYFYDYIQNKDVSTQNLTFNPLDKLAEVYSEKDQLYERIVELKNEKCALLEKFLTNQK